MESHDSMKNNEALIKSDFSQNLILNTSSKTVNKTPSDAEAVILQEGDDEVEEQKCTQTTNGEETTRTQHPRNSYNNDDHRDDFVLDSSSSKALGEEGEKPNGEKIIIASSEALTKNSDGLKSQLSDQDHSKAASLNFPASPTKFVSDDYDYDYDEVDEGPYGFDLNFSVNHCYGGNKLIKKPRKEENVVLGGNLQGGFTDEDHNGLDLELRLGLPSSAKN